jgi:hypothetical protein
LIGTVRTGPPSPLGKSLSGALIHRVCKKIVG